MSTPAETPDFYELLYRSNRIIRSHRSHFAALAAFFLLPLSVSLIIYSPLQASLSNSQLYFSTLNLKHSQILLTVLSSLFAFFLYLCAVGTINYSTIHAYHGTPPQIGSSLKSLLNTFFSLLSTCILSQAIMVMICLCFAIFAKLICDGFDILGLIDYKYSKFYAIMIGGGVVVALLVWLQLNWGLAVVVVVAEESKWGYEPLRRSAYLMKGMRRVAFSVLTIYWVFMWIFVQWFYVASEAAGGGVRLWEISTSILEAWLIAALMLNFVVANAVLYMYGKALHRDEEEEFAGEYVSLPSP